MRSRRLDNFSRHGLAWWLGLMLLLPMGQAAASWHLLSHIHVSKADAGNGHHAIHTDSCELCLTASALTGGAIPGAAVDLAPAIAPTETLVVEHSVVWAAPPLRPYESRAPPFTLA